MGGEARQPRSGLSAGRQKAKTEARKRKYLTLGNPLLQVLFFVIFIVGVVLLSNVDLGARESASSLALVGMPARADIKATRDFTFVLQDTDATERKKAEAAAAVANVYDHHIDLRDQSLDRIRKSFGEIRTHLQSAEQELRRDMAAQATGPDKEEPDGGEDAPKDAPPKVNTPREAAPELDAESLARFRLRTAEAMRDNFSVALGVTSIDDTVFELLAKGGFARASEDALLTLVDTAMQRRIAAERPEQGPGVLGVVLRTVTSGVVGKPRRILDVDAVILPMAQIRSENRIRAPMMLREITLPALREALVGLSEELIKPNTFYNAADTERAREAARLAVPALGETRVFVKGEIIVRAGTRVDSRHAEIVHQMEGEGGDDRFTRGQTLLGSLIAVLAVLALLYTYSRRNISKFRPTAKDLVLMGTLVLIQLGLLRGLSLAFGRLGEDWTTVSPDMLLYGVPLAFGAMIIRLVNNSETALIFAMLMAIFAGLAVDQSLVFGAFVLVTSLVGANSVGKLCHRMDLLKGGLMIGAVNAGMALAIFLLKGEVATWSALGAVFAGLTGGILSGILANAVLPIVEWAFEYTTDIKLLELADLNHPAIKELILKAPGTYHHSVMVGALAKEAAEAIQANPLLSRVGAYYHDIGKGKNPQYFAENIRGGHNPHDKLKPNMSALIIKSHVKDGLELAIQHGLPKEIQDFIVMHHGTTLIAYFYHKAKGLEDPDIPEVDEADYRYPGPRPQTRETAIVMLADGIEAASRSMSDPTPARLKGLVQKMINHLFADGQLDECNLTLKDLNAIAKAFIQVLTSMYYTRPKYPGQEKNPGAKAGQKRKDGDITSTAERKRNNKKKGDLGRSRGESSGSRQAHREAVEERPARTQTGELPPMDLGEQGHHLVRMTGPLPPLDQMLEYATATASPEEDVTNALAEQAELVESGLPSPDPEDQAEDAQEEGDADASGSDDQPNPEGDEVGDEGEPPSADGADPPSLRRLGLS